MTLGELLKEYVAGIERITVIDDRMCTLIRPEWQNAHDVRKNEDKLLGARVCALEAEKDDNGEAGLVILVERET